MAKTKKAETAESIAVRLSELRKRMADDKKINDALTKQFKTALESEGKREAGEYGLSTSITFKVANEEQAMTFAQDRGLIKIDTAGVHKTFQLDADLRFVDPSVYGFESVESVRVVPKSTNSNEE